MEATPKGQTEGQIFVQAQLTPIDQELAEVLDRHRQQGVQRVLTLLAGAWTQAQLMRMSGPELVSTAIKAWQSRPKGPGLYGQ